MSRAPEGSSSNDELDGLLVLLSRLARNCSNRDVHIFVRARFDAHDQRQAEFEKLAHALREQANAEPGTRTYRWFSAGDGSYLVIEEYTDAQAALAHNERAAPLLARVEQCATMIYAELYGPVGTDLTTWAQSHPQVTIFADLSPPTPAEH